MRKTMIAGNWKMFKNAEETLAFLDALEESGMPKDGVEAVICPPFLAIPSLTADPRTELLGIHVGAQNGHWEKAGAFTGEVSMQMIHEAGCHFVIIGHSERRQLMGETDEMVNKKVRAALHVGLSPIICVGETSTERQQGITGEVVSRQIKKALLAMDDTSPERIIIAYEPVWAIGSGTPASGGDAKAVHDLIRDILGEMKGTQWAKQVRILYGGSVKPDNIADFLSMDGIDGALVGGASLDPASFLSMVERAAEGRLNLE